MDGPSTLPKTLVALFSKHWRVVSRAHSSAAGSMLESWSGMGTSLVMASARWLRSVPKRTAEVILPCVSLPDARYC
jgi:hypothetical protein